MDTKSAIVRDPAACNGRCAETPLGDEPRDGVDLARIREAVREILLAVGEDPDRAGLVETPARVARMYAEVFSGLHKDPGEHLRKTFAVDHRELVLQKGIEFASTCEHHLLPFTGVAHVAYLPTGKVAGLSKLARVVEAVARRPQVQERMTQEIADVLEQELEPRGVAVVIEASHSCMTIRGVRKPGTTCVTTAMRGAFQSDAALRQELLTLVK